jgi:TPP-dependent pyruvate/acetoin dehydrogenase alpha subunit
MKKEPVLRLEKYMRSKKLLNDKYKREVTKKAAEQVEKEVEIYENLPAPKPGEMLKYVYSELTPNLKEQLDELK